MFHQTRSKGKVLNTCKYWKSCQESDSVTAQMTSVRTLSNTILVVALNSLVTLIPAKLKNAMLIILPGEEKILKL
jgi:hypothetical protein